MADQNEPIDLIDAPIEFGPASNKTNGVLSHSTIRGWKEWHYKLVELRMIDGAIWARLETAKNI